MPLTVPSTTQTSAFPHPKHKILVAEDSADSREMLQILLETKGYDVVSTDDGHGAVELAVQQMPDLVLVDLELPGLDGVSVAKELRLHPELKLVPIIIISGHDPSRYREAALSAGCDDYLLKPINFDRLDEILHERIPVRVFSARTA
jgi:DNA-binding response OmpR family regulator